MILFDGVLVKPITGEKVAKLLATASQGKGRHGHLPKEMSSADQTSFFYTQE